MRRKFTQPDDNPFSLLTGDDRFYVDRGLDVDDDGSLVNRHMKYSPMDPPGPNGEKLVSVEVADPVLTRLHPESLDAIRQIVREESRTDPYEDETVSNRELDTSDYVWIGPVEFMEQKGFHPDDVHPWHPIMDRIIEWMPGKPDWAIQQLDNWLLDHRNPE